VAKIYCKEIDEYLKWCYANPKLINKKRWLLIKNIVEPTLKRDDVFFDEETYRKCLTYCEKWYYPLFPYQKFIYAFVFMYKDDIPVFRTFPILMGRGGGKDGAFAPLMNFLQSQFYGIKGYNVDIVAMSEDQANDTFKVVYDILEDNKTTMKKYFYWNKEEVINKKTKARFRFNTSNAKTKDGKKSGAILYNEYHAYEDDKQIKVFQSGLGKIKHPRIFIITTQGDVRDGPLDELIDVCLGVLNGESNELRYFPFLCELDDEKEVDNPEMWIKANPSLPYMPILKDNMMIDYLEMQKFPSKKPEFMTKRMNIPKRNEDEAVTSWENILKASYLDVIKKIERETPVLLNKPAIVGIDFATLHDLATAGFLFKINGEYIWRKKTWICAKSKFFNDIKFPFDRQGQEGFHDFEVVHTETIDERELVGWVVEEMKKYNVKKIILDTYRYQLIKKTFEEYGMNVEDKNNPHGLIRMIRYPASIAAIIAPRIEVEFAEGNINIGDSSMMRWAINNTKVVNKKDGNKFYEKIEPKLRKNDPFMAFVCAMSGQELLDEQVVYAY
jgi:phage terminase large subunit-like protein